MNEKLKIGIIGCGYWGQNLIRNFNNIDEVDLYYICDIDEAKIMQIKTNYPNIKTTIDYQQILRDPEINAVVIALPVFKHYQIAKDALLSDKHVLIEKPMTANIQEAKELIKIANDKNKILMVDHTFEYSGPINKMKEVIESGELGNIYYIRANWFNLGLLQPDVNVIWDLATHIISIINYVTDSKPQSINANAKPYIRENISEIATINIDFSKGISAFLSVGWLEPRKTREMTIIGSKKMLVYDLMNSDEPVKIYDKGVILNENKIDYKSGEIYSPQIKNIEPLKTMCKHFIDCIRNNKKPRSDGQSGLNVIKVLEAAEKSLRNRGQEIQIE